MHIPILLNWQVIVASANFCVNTKNGLSNASWWKCSQHQFMNIISLFQIVTSHSDHVSVVETLSSSVGAWKESSLQLVFEYFWMFPYIPISTNCMYFYATDLELFKTQNKFLNRRSGFRLDCSCLYAFDQTMQAWANKTGNTNLFGWCLSIILFGVIVVMLFCKPYKYI